MCEEAVPIDEDALIAKVRVLVVEDMMINQRLLMRVLRKLGVGHSAAVSNGKEAVEMLQRERFHIVLMDLNMPVMDGLTACAEWRRWESQALARDGDPAACSPAGTGPPLTHRAFICAVTADASDEVSKKTKEVGMDSILTKPCKPDKIRHVLVMGATVVCVDPCEAAGDGGEARC